MSNKPMDQQRMMRIITWAVVIVVILMTFRMFPAVGEFFSTLFRLLTPFLVGLGIALMLKPIRDWLERKVLSRRKWKETTRRGVATFLSELILVVLIVLFAVAVIPQLTDSLISLNSSLSTYIKEMTDWVQNLYHSGTIDADLLNTISNALQDLVTYINDNMPAVMNKALSYLQNFATTIWYFVLGIVISVYFLYGYERTAHNTKRWIVAVFPKKVSDTLLYVIRTAIEIFTKFVAGKALDSLIIGLLCLVSCLVAGWEYPYLIAFIVGLTNMIPFFGPFLGAIPCALLLLFYNPWHALAFIIFILILQQFDGNYLGPKILGGQLGIPSLMIIFSVLVGGGLMGVFGMFLGVPFFALIYTLVRDDVKRREQAKLKEEKSS